MFSPVGKERLIKLLATQREEEKTEEKGGWWGEKRAFSGEDEEGTKWVRLHNVAGERRSEDEET